MKGCGIYGIGGIGALVYFLQNAQSAGAVVFAFIKALFWPAFLVHSLMGFIGM